METSKTKHTVDGERCCMREPNRQVTLPVNAPYTRLTRKPYAGNPHVRFDEGEGFLRNPLYSTLVSSGERQLFQRNWCRQTRIGNPERVDQRYCFFSDFAAELIDEPCDCSGFRAGENTIFQVPSPIRFELPEREETADSRKSLLQR